MLSGTFLLMKETLVLQFLEQINKINNKMLSYLKGGTVPEKLISEESSLINALEAYIKDNSPKENTSNNNSEELIAVMSELSNLVEKIIKVLPSLREDDDKTLNNILTSSAINIVSKVLEISEKKKK